MILEAKVGKGKLMLTSANIADTATGLANKQMYYSLIKYMQTKAFNPKDQVSVAQIKALTTTPSKYIFNAFTNASPDELKPKQILNKL
jgi:hypothetical protein